MTQIELRYYTTTARDGLGRANERREWSGLPAATTLYRIPKGTGIFDAASAGIFDPGFAATLDVCPPPRFDIKESAQHFYSIVELIARETVATVNTRLDGEIGSTRFGAHCLDIYDASELMACTFEGMDRMAYSAIEPVQEKSSTPKGDSLLEQHL